MSTSTIHNREAREASTRHSRLLPEFYLYKSSANIGSNLVSEILKPTFYFSLIATEYSLDSGVK